MRAVIGERGVSHVRTHHVVGREMDADRRFRCRSAGRLATPTTMGVAVTLGLTGRRSGGRSDAFVQRLCGDVV